MSSTTQKTFAVGRDLSSGRYVSLRNVARRTLPSARVVRIRKRSR